MKTVKRVLSLAAAAVCFFGVCQADKYLLDVIAENNLIFDYSKIEANPQSQFYYSDENEFFIDGIKVTYGGNDVTADTIITFYTTPATTYNGKDIEYVVPFIAEYDGKAAEGQLEAKIGVRGDVNLDHKVTINDLILIQNDMLQTYSNGKTSLTAHDGLGIFLGNADGRQSDKNLVKSYGTNMFNIADAFFVSNYLNGNIGSIFNSVLYGNSIKNESGEITVSDYSGNAGEIINIPVKMKSDNGIGAFDFTCKWDSADLTPIGAVSTSSEASVFAKIKENEMNVWGFGKSKALKNGELVYLQFKIANDAAINQKYNISISRINYFGTGENISDMVMAYDSTVSVTGKSQNPAIIPVDTNQGYTYDYGVRIWDEVVENGAKSAELPIMLLGGLETESITITVQCDAPLSIETLSNAVSVTGSSKEGITGVYDSDSRLPVDFETLKISIADGAAAGKYPVTLTVKEIVGVDNAVKIKSFNGSVTIKEKSLVLGDANSDNKLNVRDCAFIASKLAEGNSYELPKQADYNKDSKINVRDAAAIAKKLSEA